MGQEASGGPFNVIAKPAGPKCNLNCTYCYYKEKINLYPETHRFRMSDRVLELFIRNYIGSQDTPEIWFSWQGGEPLLLGLEFFRKVVALQRHYGPPGQRVCNALQTNGTLLNEEWAGFLREHDFLVGLSIDGPRRLHDSYRVDKRGRPSFETVLGKLKLLQKSGVEYNTLTVVGRHNADFPKEVYRFLKEHGARFMQFIPLVERIGDGTTLAGPPALDPESTPAPWSVPRGAYGDFMCAIFDEWVRHDVGRVYVQLFDVQLGIWTGLPSGLCVFAETCGRGPAIEHNGDLYACDHYVYPSYRLGNILDRPLQALVDSPRQQRFGRDKKNTLPRYCLECEFRFACNGGCPKHRFLLTSDGEPGLNYLCASYKRYFSHTAPYMRVMADLLRAGQPPAMISQLVRPGRQPTSRRPTVKVGRNDACPCGSGTKYKKCCGQSSANL
jgi:uncharacterized protein